MRGEFREPAPNFESGRPNPRARHAMRRLGQRNAIGRNLEAARELVVEMLRADAGHNVDRSIGFRARVAPSWDPPSALCAEAPPSLRLPRPTGSVPPGGSPLDRAATFGKGASHSTARPRVPRQYPTQVQRRLTRALAPKRSAASRHVTIRAPSERQARASAARR